MFKYALAAIVSAVITLSTAPAAQAAAQGHTASSKKHVANGPRIKAKAVVPWSLPHKLRFSRTVTSPKPSTVSRAPVTLLVIVCLV